MLGAPILLYDHQQLPSHSHWILSTLQYVNVVESSYKNILILSVIWEESLHLGIVHHNEVIF